MHAPHLTGQQWTRTRTIVFELGSDAPGRRWIARGRCSLRHQVTRFMSAVSTAQSATVPSHFVDRTASRTRNGNR